MISKQYLIGFKNLSGIITRTPTLFSDPINILHAETSSQRISVKQYNSEIAKAEKQITNGAFTTQEDLEKEVKGDGKKESVQSYMVGHGQGTPTRSISYKIESGRIEILRIRHTSREPLEY